MFLLIFGASFFVTASQLTGFVRDYLYEQRIHQDSLSVEKLAATVAPLFQFGQTDTLNDTLSSSAGEMGGRLLIVDADGKVQFDSFSRLMGIRLQLPEVLEVLTGHGDFSFGIHRLPDGGGAAADSSDWVAYCSAPLSAEGQRLGVLLYASPVTEMMDSLNQVNARVNFVFLAVAVMAMILAMVFASLLTKPIASMTRSIQKMGKGDLSVRVQASGSQEMRDLAESYNNMAEQLETLDRSRNQFVSNASHELKTPLTTMKILLENVLYQPDMPAELRDEFLTDMNHEIDRLSHIVGDLLTLTQMDNQKTEIKLERICFSDTVSETLRLLLPQAEKRSQRLVGQVMPNVMLMGDQSKLGQVVYNLTENALKYTPDGGRIAVGLTQRGRTAVLTVQDNGVGIPEEDQSHIFDRFYRVDKARSRETGGTGLGLSIVRQLVALHHGEISVQSEPGRGSLFTVVLPLDGKEVRECSWPR